MPKTKKRKKKKQKKKKIRVKDLFIAAVENRAEDVNMLALLYAAREGAVEEVKRLICDVKVNVNAHDEVMILL